MYQIHQDEGRVTYDLPTDKYTYEFEYRDHLGNLRLSFRDSLAAPVGGLGRPPVVVQANDYDAWGMDIKSFEQNKHDNFKYNSKENISDFGLDWIDYWARFYDKQIGRWYTVDQLADIARRYSPYVYGNNNPIRFIDPSGMSSEDFSYSDGYSTLSARNSTGSVSFSGNYSNSNKTEDPPSLLQRLMDYFGFFKKPQSLEEAKTYADRRQSLNELNERNEQAKERILEGTDGIPLLGQAAKMSDAMMKKDATGVVLSSVSFALDATGGGKDGKTNTQSLGAGRTEVKQWLSNMGSLDRSTLIKNIESAGFKRMSPSTSPVTVYERGGMRIRLAPPQSGTPYNHMHLEYGGNSYDVSLNTLNYKSPDAHIPIK